MPMAELRQVLEGMGYKNVRTILNSGNITLESDQEISALQETIRQKIEAHFGFAIPTLIRSLETLASIVALDPFQDYELTKETRFYITLLPEVRPASLTLPWQSEDKSFIIFKHEKDIVLSVLDLKISGSPEAMKILEQQYGKNITTRNWNTIDRIIKKCKM